MLFVISVSELISDIEIKYKKDKSVAIVTDFNSVKNNILKRLIRNINSDLSSEQKRKKYDLSLSIKDATLATFVSRSR